MNKIPISAITDIKEDKLFYREETGDIAFIELEPCANSYDITHGRQSKDLKPRCVGDCFFGEYAYYELYTAGHTQLYMKLKINKLKRFVSKITGIDFHARQFEQFNSVQKRLNLNGWTTFDLS